MPDFSADSTFSPNTVKKDSAKKNTRSNSVPSASFSKPSTQLFTTLWSRYTSLVAALQRKHYLPRKISASLLAGIIGAVVLAGGSLAAYTLSQSSSDLRQQAYVAGPDGSGGSTPGSKGGGDNTCGGTFVRVENGTRIGEDKCKTWERATNNGCQSDESCKMGVNQPCSDSVLCKSGLTCTPTSGGGKVCLAQAPGGSTMSDDPCQQLGTGWQQADLTCAAGQKKEDSRVGNGAYCHRCVDKSSLKSTIKPGDRCDNPQGCTCISQDVKFGSKCQMASPSPSLTPTPSSSTSCYVLADSENGWKRICEKSSSCVGPRENIFTTMTACEEYRCTVSGGLMDGRGDCSVNPDLYVSIDAPFEYRIDGATFGVTTDSFTPTPGSTIKLFMETANTTLFKYKSGTYPIFTPDLVFVGYQVGEYIEKSTLNDGSIKMTLSNEDFCTVLGGTYKALGDRTGDCTIPDSTAPTGYVYANGTCRKQDSTSAAQTFASSSLCLQYACQQQKGNFNQDTLECLPAGIRAGERCDASIGCRCLDGLSAGKNISINQYCTKDVCDANSSFSLSSAQPGTFACGSDGARYKCEKLRSSNVYFAFSSQWLLSQCATGQVCYSGECVDNRSDSKMLNQKTLLASGNKCTSSQGCTCTSGIDQNKDVQQNQYCRVAGCPAVTSSPVLATPGSIGEARCQSQTAYFICPEVTAQNLTKPYESDWETKTCGKNSICQQGRCVAISQTRPTSAPAATRTNEDSEPADDQMGGEVTTDLLPTPANTSPSSSPYSEPVVTPSLSITDAMTDAQPPANISPNQSCRSYDGTSNQLANSDGRVAEGTCEYRPSESGSLHVCQSGTWLPVSSSNTCSFTYVSPSRSQSFDADSCSSYVALECPTEACRIQGGKCMDQIPTSTSTTTTETTADETPLPVESGTSFTGGTSEETEPEVVGSSSPTLVDRTEQIIRRVFGLPDPTVVVPDPDELTRCSNDPERLVAINRVIENSAACSASDFTNKVECNYGYAYKAVAFGSLTFFPRCELKGSQSIDFSDDTVTNPTVPGDLEPGDSTSDFRSCSEFSTEECPDDRCLVEANECKVLPSCALFTGKTSQHLHYLNAVLAGSLYGNNSRCLESTTSQSLHACVSGWESAIVSESLLCYTDEKILELCTAQADEESCVNYLGICSYDALQDVCNAAL